MINSQPKVSVLMPVYNGELYIREAIDSILNQTFSDFELIIIDDCSTDGSVAVVKTYMDSRIRLIANPINQGLSFILNQGNKLARAEYIARIDCDDISLPKRLEKQVEYLDRHPDIAVLGAQSIDIDTEGKVTKNQSMYLYPVEPSSLRWTASYLCPFRHPLVMYRRQILWEKLGGYDETISFAEDYEIWQRLLNNNYQGANLPEILLKYRVHPKSMMNTASTATKTNTVSPMRKEYLDKLIPGYDREKEIVVNFFAIHNPNLALATNAAMDTLRDQYVSIYLDGKMTKDLSINMARERADISYCLFPVDRWKATSLMLKAIWQYPGLLRELPLAKVIYLILFGASGRELFRSFQSKSN
jgi:Glycosyl transferase family 2